MPPRDVRARRRAIILLVLAAAVVVLFVATWLLSRDDEPSSRTSVTLFMSYVPSVQFAPVYVAAERGYFADEGIDLRLEHSLNEADGVERIASNDLKFGLVSGEQVVLARARQRPVVYVFEWYHRFPVGVVSLADRGDDQGVVSVEDSRYHGRDGYLACRVRKAISGGVV